MKAISVLLLAASLLLAGCATSVNTVERADPQARPQLVNDRRVVTDRSLEKAFAVVEVAEARVSGDLLRIQVTLRNNGRRTRTVNYQFEFIGEDGMVLQTTQFISLRIDGGDSRAVSAVANSPRAVDFRLRLLEPRLL